MPRLSLWNVRKGSTYRTLDKWISQQYRIGGTGVYLHKYIGPVATSKEGDASIPNLAALGGSNELTIQDLFFLENRDRRYDPNVYEMRAIYQLNDQDFDLTQFGLFLPNDIYFLSFHLTDTVDQIGRKIMSGDVVELPHMRDDISLDPNRPAINKYYVVTDVTREAAGFSPTWWPHTLRVKIEPMTDSQEFADILDAEASTDNDGLNDVAGMTLRDILSSYNDEIKITEALIEAAEQAVPETGFETAHLYIAPDENGNWNDPWIFAGDGEPPNGAQLLGSGSYFPENVADGEWFLRTDYVPPILYRKRGHCWVRQEVDYRRKWKTATRILESFINNDKEVKYTDGTLHNEKQPLSKAIKPKVDM
jgi:hypothetical protein